MKPWVGMWGVEAARMVDSTCVKGPGGEGWLYEWYARTEEGYLLWSDWRKMRLLDAIIVVVVECNEIRV